MTSPSELFYNISKRTCTNHIFKRLIFIRHHCALLMGIYRPQYKFISTSF